MKGVIAQSHQLLHLFIGVQTSCRHPADIRSDEIGLHRGCKRALIGMVAGGDKDLATKSLNRRNLGNGLRHERDFHHRLDLVFGTEFVELCCPICITLGVAGYLRMKLAGAKRLGLFHQRFNIFQRTRPFGSFDQQRIGRDPIKDAQRHQFLPGLGVGAVEIQFHGSALRGARLPVRR